LNQIKADDGQDPDISATITLNPAANADSDGLDKEQCSSGRLRSLLNDIAQRLYHA
jgi:hypothetical protein